MIISLIVVADQQNGIGINNRLLCHLPADLSYFRRLTTGHHIVMGRRTYESVGRPLPHRTNIVVSASVKEIPGCVVVAGLQEAISYAQAGNETELFITGGGVIFNEALPLAHRLYITRIEHTFAADTFFPPFDPAQWNLVKNEPHDADEKNPFPYTFMTYERKS
jgi:dihydrofolate reductase